MKEGSKLDRYFTEALEHDSIYRGEDWDATEEALTETEANFYEAFEAHDRAIARRYFLMGVLFAQNMK